LGPAPRGYASFTSIDNSYETGRFVLFGGKSEPPTEKYFNDTWMLTVTKGPDGSETGAWKELVGDVSPPGRFYHKATKQNVMWSDDLYVFGGAERPDTVVVNDLWALGPIQKDPVEMHWSLIEKNTSNTSTPTARQGMTLVMGDDIILFGGRPGTAKGAYGDVWTYSRSDKWILRQSGTTFARAGHAAAIVNQTMLVFGGSFIGLDPPYVETYYNDLLALDTKSFQWTVVQTNGGTDDPARPWKRNGHSLDFVNGRLVLFGGYGLYQGLRNDVWEYTQ